MNRARQAFAQRAASSVVQKSYSPLTPANSAIQAKRFLRELICICEVMFLFFFFSTSNISRAIWLHKNTAEINKVIVLIIRVSSELRSLNSRLSGLREKRLASTKGDLKECRDRHAGFVAHSYAYVGSGARTSAENKFRIRKIYWQFITF